MKGTTEVQCPGCGANQTNENGACYWCGIVYRERQIVIPTPETILSSANSDERRQMTVRDLLRAIELIREEHGDAYIDVPVVLRVENPEGELCVGGLYDLEIDDHGDGPAMIFDAAEDAIP